MDAEIKITKPDHDTLYWSIDDNYKVNRRRWHDTILDNSLLNSKNFYTSKEDAIEFLRSMLNNSDDSIKILAVRGYLKNLGLIKNPSQEVINAAMLFNYNVLEFLEQNEEICLSEVKSSGGKLRFVKNKTLKICLAAFEEDPCSYEFMDDDMLRQVFSSLTFDDFKKLMDRYSSRCEID